MAKTSARIVPTRNSGSAMNASVPFEIAWSTSLPRRVPARTPSPIAVGNITSTATPASASELTRRAEISDETDVCARERGHRDRPSACRRANRSTGPSTGSIEPVAGPDVRQRLGRGLTPEEGARRIPGQHLGRGEHERRDDQGQHERDRPCARRCTPRRDGGAQRAAPEPGDAAARTGKRSAPVRRRAAASIVQPESQTLLKS